MNRADIEIIRQKLKIAVLIWGVFLISILLYAGAVEWMQRGESHLAGTQNRTLHLTLLAAAAVCFVGAGIVKYLTLRVPARKPTWGVELLANRLVNASVVSLALSEAICLMGLIEYFVLRDYDSFYLFFIVAMLGIILHMPRYPQWKTYLEEMTGTTLPPEAGE